MSGTQKSPAKRAQAKTRTTIVWDSYVAEAALEPFVITFADATRDDIVIDEPDGGTLMDAQDAAQNMSLEDQLRMVAGSSADEIVELLRKAPQSAVMKFVNDVMHHFGLGAVQLGEDSASTS